MSSNLLQCFGQCTGQSKKRCPLADKAFLGLSPEEQDRVYRDLYGTEEPMKESPELILNKLANLDEELGILNEETTKYYTHAVNIEKQQQQLDTDSKYVTDPKFRLAFLRAERFDASKAARRLARYFAEKYELFGEDKLARRIKKEDFVHHQDAKALITGGLSYTGATDRAGRSIVMVRRDQIIRENFISLKRVFFYMFQNLIEENEISQKLGVVVIGYHLNALPLLNPTNVRLFFPLVRMMIYAIPFRVAGLHYFYCDLKDQFIYNLALVVCPREIRARFCGHYQQTYQESMIVLMHYGISPNSLPLTEEGDFQHDMLWEYLQKRHRIEEVSNPDNNSNAMHL